ncbi:MAG: hypothetical protein ING75_10680 [Rhodocyclaceae bacterium]|nr:hypothetical protein [Rhodocyclaceae bacterium]
MFHGSPVASRDVASEQLANQSASLLFWDEVGGTIALGRLTAMCWLPCLLLRSRHLSQEMAVAGQSSPRDQPPRIDSGRWRVRDGSHRHMLTPPEVPVTLNDKATHSPLSAGAFVLANPSYRPVISKHVRTQVG